MQLQINFFVFQNTKVTQIYKAIKAEILNQSGSS